MLPLTCAGAMLQLAVQVLTILVKQHVQMSVIFATSGMSPQVLQCNKDDTGAGAPLDFNIPETVSLACCPSLVLAQCRILQCRY
jgi:hypothetical protein